MNRFKVLSELGFISYLLNKSLNQIVNEILTINY